MFYPGIHEEFHNHKFRHTPFCFLVSIHVEYNTIIWLLVAGDNKVGESCVSRLVKEDMLSMESRAENSLKFSLFSTIKIHLFH